jgi:hypothetical protein
LPQLATTLDIAADPTDRAVVLADPAGLDLEVIGLRRKRTLPLARGHEHVRIGTPGM